MGINKLIGGALALVLTFSAAPLAALDTASKCEHVGAIARSVMKHRQDGVSKTTMVKINKSIGGSNSSERFYEFVIADAFQRPRQETKASQQKMIAEFEKEYLLTCFERALADNQ